MPHTPPTLRVLVVDDQPLFRKALAGLLNAQLDMTVVGEADDGIEALERVRALAPDVVVMDVNMPVAGGVDGVRAIRAAGYPTKIVMLTISEEDDDLFDDAVRLVFEFGKASTSLLQRRLRIGYGRAAHLIDMMERDGLVGPADGSKPREILKSPSYFAEVDATLR